MPYKIDYPVPDLGMDEDVVASMKSEAKAGKEIYHHHYDHDSTLSGTEEDLRFEHDIAALIEHTTNELMQQKKEANASKNPSDPICSSSGWCGDKWPKSKKDEDKVVEYATNVPLDKDIKDSKQHMKEQEAIHGTWNLTNPKDASSA